MISTEYSVTTVGLGWVAADGLLFETANGQHKSDSVRVESESCLVETTSIDVNLLCTGYDFK